MSAAVAGTAAAAAGFPWLTVIMAVLSFFLAGGADKDKRAKAALVAAGVGAATYATTHHTDWGKQNLGMLDGVQMTELPDGSTAVSTSPTDPGSVIKPGSGSSSTSGSNGFWSTLTGWLTSPAGQVTTGVAGASALGVPNWLLWGGVLLGGYLILKD